MIDEDANDLRAFVAKLSEMPTEYFETKFERPVMLNEFAGALVPSDLPADLKDVLKENALQVYEYDREGDRTRALADATRDLAQRRKVLFQSVKGSTVFQSNGQRIIQLFESADESTFLHEMSHIYLDELKQLAEMAPDSDAGKDYATIMAWASYKEGASAEYAGTATASEFASRTGGVD